MARKTRARSRAARGDEDVTTAIVEAAHRLLAESGYAALSTNRIAREAGISVGTLYHWFPNKEAVVAELARRLELRGLEVGLNEMDAVAAIPLPDLARALTGVLLSDALGVVPARTNMLRHVPPRWFEEVSVASDGQARNGIAALVEKRRAELRAAPADVMAFVAYHALEGVVEAAVQRAPELLRDPAFHDELVELLLGYVRA